MKIYNYDDEGIYIGESTANPSPLEQGKYLIPAKATTVKPPASGDNEVAVFKDDQWVIEKDFRGETYYTSESREPITIDEIGEEIPDGALTSIDPKFIKEDKCREAEVIRYELLTNDIEYNGKSYQSDDVSVRNMTVKLAGIGDGSTTWRTSDNEEVTLVASDLEAMLKIIGDRGDQVYQASWSVKGSINASNDPESIDVRSLYEDELT